MKRHLLFLPLIVLTSPRFAAAQSQPVIEARTAFGISNYLHADIEYTSPTWLIAARIGHGAMAIEPEFVLQRHEETQTFGQAGPAPTVQTSNTRFQSVAVNVIGRWGSRVSGYVGGGIGAYTERFRFRQTFNGQETGHDRTQGPRAGVQLVGGVDVPVAPRIKIFGQGRYEMRSFDDPGGGSVVQGLGGVAIVLR